MNDAAVVALSPETVLGEMKKNGVTHVCTLCQRRVAQIVRGLSDGPGPFYS
jgi:hypothetical protein